MIGYMPMGMPYQGLEAKAQMARLQEVKAHLPLIMISSCYMLASSK